MTGMVRGFGFYTLAGALVLGGIVFLAAPQAQAATLDDFFDLELEGIGCDAFEMIVDAHVELCDDIYQPGGGCTVDADECTKLCSKESKSCWKMSKVELNAVKSEVNLGAKLAKRLCKTTADPGTCKAGVKAAKGLFKDAYKIVKADTKAQCTSEKLITSCEEVCNAAPESEARAAGLDTSSCDPEPQA
jgi:hypothetical protein